MDPLSVGASQLQLQIRSEDENCNDKNTKQDDAFREVITSCRSLSSFETSCLKTAMPQIGVSICSASFHIVVGVALSYSAVLVPQLEAEDSGIPVTKFLTSLVASIITLMVPVGAIIAGYMMDSLGRINTIKVAAIPAILGLLLIATATNVYFILAGRIFTGVACAMGTSPAIVYITEVARADLRGSLISSGPTLASFGMVLTYIAGAFLNWRTVAWLGILFTIFPIILIWIYVPESPVYLVTHGRIEDAAKSLQFLYKKYPPPENSLESLADMHLRVLMRDNEKRLNKNMLNVNSKGKQKSKWAGFAKPTGYKPLTILFFFFLIQQFSGIYITLFFSVTFLQDVGADGIDPFVASIFLGVVRFVMSCLNAWLLKRFKRRFLVMLSSFLMAALMFISGTVTIWIQNGATELKWVPVVCLLLYVCASMIGLLMIPWTMTAELFPNEIRGLGHSLSFSIANVIMFFAVQSYRTLLDVLGGSHAVQWFFALISIIGFFFGLFFLPETHGKKLSEIEAYFEKKSSSKKSRVVASDIYNVSTNAKEIEQMLTKKENA
ncbi:CLUMA_CG007469, isoform A [Clunio marinus]|uniref:CLUMA_CG007469, isoform A n=1 Tax=Clunio marinus TaxID=568069 RepID=A0A1J1I4W7_9DIPT|nr:CLUMA_CG007469, isoform A [Clunio marinus]